MPMSALRMSALLATLICCLAGAAFAAKPEDALQGVWKIATATMGGRNAPEKRLAAKPLFYAFAGDKYKVYGDGAALGSGTFKPGAGSLDFVVADGAANPMIKPVDEKGSTVAALYRLDADVLSLCFALEGGKPTALSGQGRQMLLTFKKSTEAEATTRTPESFQQAARACFANRKVIGGAIEMWQVDMASIPPGTTGSITFDADGVITEVTGGLDQITGASKTLSGLKPGSKDIVSYTKYPGTFVCMEQARTYIDGKPAKPEAHFKFLISPTPLPELGGKKKGIICLHFGAKGPAGHEDLKHEPFDLEAAMNETAPSPSPITR